ncbi:MAG: hypothetical protein ACJ72N_25925 [Labedaea sp.]
MIRTRVVAAAAGLLALSALPACGVNPQSVPGKAVPAAQPDSAGVTLAVADDGTLGSVVIDQNGHTLYRFDRDKSTPSTSNCNDACAKSWPPVIVRDAGEVQLADVDKNLVGTMARKDGRTQLTLGGWPLYRYAEDRKAGDLNGQGVGGTWFASTPQGKKAQAAAPAPVPDAGGY